MRLVGANPRAAVAGAEQLPGRANYFIGNDPKRWRTNVPTYAKVRYHNVYPGVDLEYYGNQAGQLEYDFIVAPGADPSAISLAVDAGQQVGSGQKAVGSGQPKIDSTGDLVVNMGGHDEVRFHKPVVYQPAEMAFDATHQLADRKQSTTDHGPRTPANPKSKIENPKPVQGRFCLAANNQVTFEVSGYDKTKPLVVDPVLTYSTYLGGSGSNDNDEGLGIAVDSSGDAYVTGSTGSSDFPTVNPLQASNNGGSDVFVAKLDAAGSALVYSTYLGGSAFDVGAGIAVDSSGNAYVTGRTQSTDFPTVNPLQATNKAGADYNAFVAKLNPDGNGLVYSTYLGGSGSSAAGGDKGNGIAVDTSGDAAVTGTTCSMDFPTVNPLQTSNKSYANYTCTAFVSKLNASGSALVYSTYLGGSGGDGGSGITVDSSGNAYVTGNTNSTDFPTVSALESSYNGGEDAFVAKLNAAGSALVYSTYLGGSSSDKGFGIAVDSSGNAYVTGETYSADFPTVNPLQASVGGSELSASLCPPPGCADVFVAKLNATGSALMYSTYLGGSDDDLGTGIAVDSSGNAYVVGWTMSADFPTADPVQATKGNENVGTPTTFVAEVNAVDSVLIYSTYLGGSSEGTGIAVDSLGNAHLTGYTGSTDFPTVNPLQATNNDLQSSSAFVAMLSPGPAPAVSFSTPSLSFGSENTTSPPQSVFVTNLGNATLSISGISASGDFALITTAYSCPYGGGMVAPEANCTVDVTFTPTATGVRTGTLTVTDNASGSPHTVQLNGTGSVSVPIVSPASLSFDNQLVGTMSAPQSVTVTNTNSAILNISVLAMSMGWKQSNNCLPSVGPNASCTINVSFQPTAGGYQTGTLTLTDNASNSPQTVTLGGMGLAPVVRLSPTRLTFGGQAGSNPSAPQTVTLTNTGTGVLTPLTIATAGDFAQTNNCGGSLAPNASCSITVTFTTPTALGNQTGALILTDNAPYSPQMVTLSGTGAGPGASLSAASVNFGSQLVGTASSAQQVTLQNAGTQALTINSISLTGANGSDFSLSQNCPSSLATNASCQINVTFTPNARGADTATVSLVDSGANSPQSIALTGTGIAPVASLSPTSLTFPGQFVGTTGLPENITLTSNGDVPLNISSIQASAQFGSSNGCTSPLAVGSNCTISVFFDPSSAGSQTGTLTITDNAPGSPQTVRLSGTGQDFQMSSSTTSETVTAGQTATYSLNMAPQGGFNQTVKLTCNGAPSLSTCAVSPSSVALNGTASAAVTVQVTTTASSQAPPLDRVIPPNLRGLERMFWLCTLLWLAGVGALAGMGKRRAACLLGAYLLTVMLWSACGGGGGQVVRLTGTPPGTYTLDVSATVTSAASPSTLTHDFKFTLTVQ